MLKDLTMLMMIIMTVILSNLIPEIWKLHGHGNAEGLHYADDDYYDSDVEQFDTRKLHGDSVGLDDVNDNCYDHNDDIEGGKSDDWKFHGDAVDHVIDDDFDHDHEQFHSIRFHGVSKIYVRIHNNWLIERSCKHYLKFVRYNLHL